MKWTIVSAFAGLVLVAGITAAQTTAARTLKHDPFDWSALQQAVEKKPDAAPPAASETPPPVPKLRAVMRGPSGARVDLEGVILSVGDTIDGYRLLEVRDYSAVFSKDGAAVELNLGQWHPQ